MFHEDLRGWISVGMHDAQSEQIEFGTAVHGALGQLQAVNMSFDWTVAPRLLKGGKQRGFIVTEVFCETCQQAAFCAVLPVGPSVILAFWFGPATAVKFGPLGQHWLGFMDGATEA